jgi:hypothetical protein
MALRTAIACVLVVVLFVPASWAQGQTDLWHSFAEKLPPGARVVVRLTNGSTVQGQVVRITQDAMTVLPKKRLPEPVRVVAFDDVQSIETRKEGMSPGAKVLAGAGAAAGVMLLILVSALASGGWD